MIQIHHKRSHMPHKHIQSDDPNPNTPHNAHTKDIWRCAQSTCTLKCSQNTPHNKHHTLNLALLVKNAQLKPYAHDKRNAPKHTSSTSHLSWHTHTPLTHIHMHINTHTTFEHTWTHTAPTSWRPWPHHPLTHVHINTHIHTHANTHGHTHAHTSPTSLMEAMATPPMMGSRVSKMRGCGCSPRNSALRATLNAGSIACVHVNDTKRSGAFI